MRAWGLLAALLLLLPGAPALGIEDVRPVHPPIVVQGDEGLAAGIGNGVTGGSGTAADPYRISGWFIVSRNVPAIAIRDTRAHVEIVDVEVTTLDQLVFGLSLRNVTNLTLRASYFHEMGAGVEIVDSDGVLIDRVEFRGIHHPYMAMRSRGIVTKDSVFVARGELPIVEDGRASFYAREGTRDLVFLRNRFDGTGIIFDDHTGAVTIVDSTFVGAGMADSIYGPGALYMCGNRFDVGPGGQAVFLVMDGGPATLSGNVFSGGRRAVGLFDATPMVLDRNLFFQQGDESIWLGEGGVLRENAFLGPGAAILYAGADARWNWWGAPSGPGGDGPGSGSPLVSEGAEVLVEPWLVAPPERGVDCIAEAPAWAPLGSAS